VFSKRSSVSPTAANSAKEDLVAFSGDLTEAQQNAALSQVEKIHKDLCDLEERLSQGQKIKLEVDILVKNLSPVK